MVVTAWASFPASLVNIDSLDVQQLAQVKKQIEEEVEHLGSSFAQLHAAQVKFKDCLRCVQARSASSKGMCCAVLLLAVQ